MKFCTPEIGRSINQEFFQPKYEEFRKWNFANYNKQQLQDFKDEFYNCIECHKKDNTFCPMVLWETLG